MKLKQFLKPDWRKIVLTVILSVWFLFGLIIVGGEGGLNAILTITGLVGVIISLPIILLLFLIQVKDMMWGVIYIVLDIIYAFVLSCFIIWIYNKYSKKGKK